MKKLALLMFFSSSLLAQDWVVHKDSYPFTDADNYVAVVDGVREKLYARCINNKSQIVISSEKYIGRKSQTITYRVDAGHIQKAYAKAVKGGDALIIQDDFNFVSNLYGSQKLFVRYENNLGKTIRKEIKKP